MKSPRDLTATQADCATCDDTRLLIEAGPGTGKTRTATERYGNLLYRRPDRPECGTAVLSFTVAATALLRRRITDRWGRSSLAWPNRVRTLDSEFRSILEFLLRASEIAWPNEHRTLTYRDNWADRDMIQRPIGPSWIPTLEGRNVAAVKIDAIKRDIVVTVKKRLVPQLDQGWCTHDGVRDLVVQASEIPDLRRIIVQFLRTTTTCVLVDEAFDANESDVELLVLFAEADCDMTLVGDPWQALYGFREAEPAILRKRLITQFGFRTIPLTQSFRFDSEQTRRLASTLRQGRSCATLPVVCDPDIVLAREWAMLWETPSFVLPLAFGQVQSQISAALSLLLDHFIRSRARGVARMTPSACHLLGISKETYHNMADEAFDPTLALLRDEGAAAAEKALTMVQTAAKEILGAKKRPMIRADQRYRYIRALANLARRLAYEAPLTTGLTVHQAKGQEWDRVAVVLSEDDHILLREGLDQDGREARRIYVSLTRGRLETGVPTPN